MFNLEPKPRGRGIPKGEHKIIRVALRKEDPTDMRCYDKIDTVAKKRKTKRNRVAKDFLKKNMDKIE